jgi:glycosyltransferase involved in cell wall biosynthesis
VTTLLSDELLSGLMAVGQVDVLVGLPTLNHSDSVGPVVRAAHVAFNRELTRERTVLVNVDGGSVDGTPDIVRDASIVERETLLASHSLRTRHRISGPYHGVPGKAAALRTVFAAADLLQARAVVVLDPEIASVTPESVAALARAALGSDTEFVSPAYARHPLDGPLVTQVVRPLFRAAYGLALSEPLAGEFGCSGRFAARCLEDPAWESDDLRLSIDLWISGMAAGGGGRVTELALGPRRLTARPRPAVVELVPQVLDALFTCLRLQEERWTARADPTPVAQSGTPGAPPEPTTSADGTGYAALFREGLSALGPILERALEPTTLEALRSTPGPDGTVRIPDELWAAVIRELAVAHRRAAVSRDHLLRAAVPVYLGRVASFVTELSGLDPAEAEGRLEALCLHFERTRGELVSLWTAHGR